MADKPVEPVEAPGAVEVVDTSVGAGVDSSSASASDAVDTPTVGRFSTDASQSPSQSQCPCPFPADIGVVEGAKEAVRTLARRLEGVADSEVTVPASAEVSFQVPNTSGVQWVMTSDLTKDTLYFVTYEAPQMAYFVDAYAPIPGGRLTAPMEHSYA